MNKKMYLTAIIASALFLQTSCSGKNNKENGNVAQDATEQNADETKQDGSQQAKPYPWDFPEGIALENPETGQYVLSIHTFYPKKIVESENPDKETYIFYSTKLNEYGETHSTVNGSTKMPNSLIILLPKGKKAKVGDVLLTWWQSGSGMNRAIVTDASNPEMPKVDYLDLHYSDDPDKPEMANKKSNEQLKAGSFDILEDGKWQPGATIAAFDGSNWKECTLIHATDDKVLAIGFAGKIKAYKRSACKLIPIRQNLKAGDNVTAVWVGSFNDGYKVKKVDRKIGRVWVEKNGQTEIVSILQVVKSL